MLHFALLSKRTSPSFSTGSKWIQKKLSEIGTHGCLICVCFAPFSDKEFGAPWYFWPSKTIAWTQGPAVSQRTGSTWIKTRGHIKKCRGPIFQNCAWLFQAICNPTIYSQSSTRKSRAHTRVPKNKDNNNKRVIVQEPLQHMESIHQRFGSPKSHQATWNQSRFWIIAHLYTVSNVFNR